MKHQPPEYIMDFLKVVYPGSEELALTVLDEKTALMDATQTIINLRADFDAARAEERREAIRKVIESSSKSLTGDNGVTYLWVEKAVLDAIAKGGARENSI